MSLPVPATSAPDATPKRERARVRAAAVRQRLTLASDALAAVDLLLGVNHSLRALSEEESR